jgi:nucleoside-diphosphate-sugar epimerase
VKTIFVTGASGAIGPHLLAALLRELPGARLGVLLRPGPDTVEARIKQLRWKVTELSQQTDAATCDVHERLFPIAGDVCSPQCGVAPALAQRLRLDATCVIHAAADTRFQADPTQQRETNVEGTRHMLDWARECKSLERLVLVSTTCVAGARTGPIAEEVIPIPPPFVNSYEQTKWEAEQLAAHSGLPLTIVRLATCAGSQVDGSVERLGGLHRALQWMLRGLVPMVPGRPECPVDLIPTELAASLIARAAALGDRRRVELCHASSGASAPTLAELLVALSELFSRRDVAWRRGQITAPPIVAAETFANFRQTVESNGDLLFQSVIASVDAFLPALLNPKTFETTAAQRLWGGPLPLLNWREQIGKVIDYCIANRWCRSNRGVAVDV